MRCAGCGGLNPPGAEWCGQCFRSFAPSPEPAEERAGAVPRELDDLRVPPPGGPARHSLPKGAGAAAPQRRDAFTVGEEGISWSCAVCDTPQPLDASTCAVCGAGFAEVLRAREGERPQKDPNMAALLSLLFPGAGHAYLGLWGQTMARAVLSTFVSIVFVVSASTPGGPLPVSFAFGISAFGLWVAAAHDAHREASGEPGRVLLKNNAFLYVVLGLLCLLFAILLVSFLNARGSL